jgi:hypothetical protein
MGGFSEGETGFSLLFGCEWVLFIGLMLNEDVLSIRDGGKCAD